MGKHALLSASSSHRWLNCTPSARLEEQFKSETSAFAEEGTAAHELSEYKIRIYIGQVVNKPVSKYDSEELDMYTEIYLNFATELIESIRAKCKDPIILLEQKLDYSNYVQDGFGTGDLVIIADGTVDIVDLKYGKGVQVSAEDNPQMKLYAIGALNLFDSLYDIKTVRMTICQPRLENISTYEIFVEELINWAETELKSKAKLAYKGEGEFAPSEYTCKFCKARQVCRARSNWYLELAKYDFKLPELLNDNEISEVLILANSISDWVSDVYAYASDMAINRGKELLGFKLVEGRSNRKYTNETAVVEAVTKQGYTDIYKKTLIGITEMEKLLGKKKFNELLGNLVEKPKGKPTLVPESDKREKIKLNNTAEADFKEEI